MVPRRRPGNRRPSRGARAVFGPLVDEISLAATAAPTRIVLGRRQAATPRRRRGSSSGGATRATPRRRRGSSAHGGGDVRTRRRAWPRAAAQPRLTRGQARPSGGAASPNAASGRWTTRRTRLSRRCDAPRHSTPYYAASDSQPGRGSRRRGSCAAGHARAAVPVGGPAPTGAADAPPPLRASAAAATTAAAAVDPARRADGVMQLSTNFKVQVFVRE